MSEHTLGPWIITTDQFGRAAIWASGDENPKSNRLAIAHTVYNHVANARLIAVAPELFRVAILAKEFVENIEQNDALTEYEQTLLDAARVAIAKVGGAL